MTRAGPWACAAAVALLAACNDPHLAISTKSATVPAGSSTRFQALAQDSDGTILWTLSGPGSLDVNTGQQVTYTAPATYDPAGTNTATLRVRLSDASDQHFDIAIQITKPGESVAGFPGLQANVTVDYDERNIPRISCAKTVDCYAVLGYVQARDRFFEMDFLRRAARGKLAELIGDPGLAQDQASRTVFTVRSRDDATRAVPLAEEFWTYIQASDPASAAIVSAYTRGVNAWLKTMRADPKLVPGEYQQISETLRIPFDASSTTDIPDWSEVDTAAAVRLQEFQLSSDIGKKTDYGKWAATYGQGPLKDLIKVGAWIRSKMPYPSYTLAGSGAPEAPSLVAGPVPDARLRGVLDGVQQRMAPFESLLKSLGQPSGSNNWVVDGAHSATGQSIVANDPHLSLQYPALFHLSHIVSAEDQRDVMGAIFPGIPAHLIGRGAHVGWGVTVVGYDVTELYLEKLTPTQTGFTALYNGAQVPVLVSAQKIGMRTKMGTIGEQDFTVLVVPHHGPVVSLDKGTGDAVSVRWTGHETHSDELRAIYRLNNAKDVQDAVTALSGDQKPDGGFYTGFFTGAQNFVLADDKGQIGYDPHACVPQRLWATKKDLVYPAPATPVPGTGGLEWGDNLGAALCVPNDKLPFAVGSTKGFLATANSDPLGASDDDNPYENNPNGAPYLSFDWDDPLGPRIQRIQSFLAERTATGGKVSLDDVHALQADHVLTLATPFLADLEANGAATSGDANVKAGWTLLSAWRANGLNCPTGLLSTSTTAGLDPVKAALDPDPKNATDSAACLLFHTFIRKLMDATFADDAAVAGVSIDPGAAIRAFLFLVSPEGVASNPNSSLCRDVDGAGQPVGAAKTCSQQALSALGWAYARLASVDGAETNWRWGRVHTVTFANYLAPLVGEGWNPGPFARPGGIETVDVASPRLSRPDDLAFPFFSAGNVRWAAVMDGTLANTTMQLPGRERDRAFDPRAQGTLGQWLNNTYFQFPYKSADLVSFGTETYSP